MQRLAFQIFHVRGSQLFKKYMNSFIYSETIRYLEIQVVDKSGNSLRVNVVPFPTEYTSKPWEKMGCVRDKKLNNILGYAFMSIIGASLLVDSLLHYSTPRNRIVCRRKNVSLRFHNYLKENIFMTIFCIYHFLISLFKFTGYSRLENSWV